MRHLILWLGRKVYKKIYVLSKSNYLAHASGLGVEIGGSLSAQNRLNGTRALLVRLDIFHESF